MASTITYRQAKLPAMRRERTTKRTGCRKGWGPPPMRSLAISETTGWRV
jgi:hypothetical protein